MRLQGTVWRAHNPRWSFAPESGDGAALHGGRFNRIGSPALYTSLRFETAWLEAQQGFAFKVQPLTLCAYAVDCADLADLTDPGTCRELRVEPADLACPGEYLLALGQMPPSWLLADRLAAAGCAGLQAPSRAPGATPFDLNVVFWRWEAVPPHQVKVIDPERRLPRNPLSWR